MTFRELLGVTLKDEAKGLPIWIQAVGYAVFIVLVGGLAYVGAMTLGTYGSLLGVVIGVVLGSCIAVALLRAYRARPQSDA